MDGTGPGRGVGAWVGRVVVVVLVVAVGWLLVEMWGRVVSEEGEVGGVSVGVRAGEAESVEAVLAAARGESAERAERVLRAGLERYGRSQALWVALAECLVGRGAYEEAYGAYREALEIGPRDAVLEFAAGVMASRVGDYEAAEGHFVAAQAGDPSEARYPLHLAQVQMAQERWESAKASLLHVLRLSPGDATASGMLAELYLRENKAGLALQHVTVAREAEPEVSAWKVIEAKALKRLGRVEEALLVVRSLPEEDRRTVQVLRLYGECCGMLGLEREAAEAWASASDARPEEAQIAYEAAVWLERVGEGERALGYARRSAGLGHAGAAAWLARRAGGQ